MASAYSVSGFLKASRRLVGRGALSAFFVVSAFALPGNAAETIVTKAPMAFLYEPGSGTILFAK